MIDLLINVACLLVGLLVATMLFHDRLRFDPNVSATLGASVFFGLIYLFAKYLHVGLFGIISWRRYEMQLHATELFAGLAVLLMGWAYVKNGAIRRKNGKP